MVARNRERRSQGPKSPSGACSQRPLTSLHFTELPEGSTTSQHSRCRLEQSAFTSVKLERFSEYFTAHSTIYLPEHGQWKSEADKMKSKLFLFHLIEKHYS
jgi:hypothetical protein